MQSHGFEALKYQNTKQFCSSIAMRNFLILINLVFIIVLNKPSRIKVVFSIIFQIYDGLQASKFCTYIFESQYQVLLIETFQFNLPSCIFVNRKKLKLARKKTALLQSGKIDLSKHESELKGEQWKQDVNTNDKLNNVFQLL